jgi:hypothetical protein
MEGCAVRRDVIGDCVKTEGRSRRRRNVTGIVAGVVLLLEWRCTKVEDARRWMTKRRHLIATKIRR